MQQGFRREFGIARSKIQHGLLLGGLLAVIGFAILIFGPGAVPDAVLIGSVNLVIATGILVYNLRAANDARPRLVVDGHGVWFREWNLDPIPWSEIGHVGTAGARVQAYVSVTLRDMERLFGYLPEETRRKLRSNRLVRPPDLRIPHGAVEASLDDIVAAIEAGRRAYA
jgi:hypothetical protein